MKGTEFAATYGPLGLAGWEAAAVELAKHDLLGPFVWKNIPVEGGGFRGVVRVSNDVVGVGEPGDVLRLPLTPSRAQDIANTLGALLPTRKLVKDIWRAADAKLTPAPMVPNKGADMGQYVSHSSVIDVQLYNAGFSPDALVSGDKKDVVISNAMKPGRVVIYGWMKPDGSPIQPLTNVHGDFYVDYSHGIRLVAPTMNIEGVGEVSTETAYKHPTWSALVSDEGPLQVTRYSSKEAVTTPSMLAADTNESLLELGLKALVYYSQWRST